MTIREQLRAAYLIDGRAAVDICAEAGVSRATFFNALSGRPVLTNNLFALCAALRVSSLDVPARESNELDTR
jgi:hypothetical protein